MTELRPWQSGESILDAVRRLASEPGEAFELPDEPPPDPTQIRWSPGSWDGVATRHMAPTSRDSTFLARARRRLGRRTDPAAEIFARLADLARAGGERERLAVYRAAQDPDILQHVDAVLERVVDEPGLFPPLARHARWLVNDARHRGPAKLGIALLGVCGDASDLDAIKTLARHDEFTLYCSVAIRNIVADPVDALWEIAQAADGWGKIEAVERLAPLVADRADVKRWLLVDGCQNAVMNEYLGYACATAGGLAAALAGDVDEPLLDGACTIVSALCDGGPAEDLDDYADGPEAVTLLLGVLEKRCTTLQRLETVLAVKRWLEPDESGSEPPDAEDPQHLREVSEREARRVGFGWTDDLRARLLTTCAEILSLPEWPDRVRTAFSSGERGPEWLAWQIAPHVGVDLWEAAFAMLERGPLDDTQVFRAVNVADRDRQRRVIEWAEANLPLDRIATGPDRHLFPDSETGAIDHALMWVVQEMRSPDLYSERLVAAALRAPVISTRNGALNALDARPRAEWGASVEEALRQTALDDPDDEVRARVVAVRSRPAG